MTVQTDILFLCQYFYPDQNSSATLPFDTARALAAQGCRVRVLCGYPKEYTDRTDTPLRETIDGVEICRVRYLQLPRGGKIGRLVNFLSFTLACAAQRRLLRESRSVLVYSNPPVLPAVALLAKRRWGAKLVFVSYDVYPEIALISGALRAGGVIDRGMRRLNAALFRRADAVVALTEQMRDYLLAHRSQLTPERVRVIPNWAHETRAARDGTALADYGIPEDAFVVAYCGNLGELQDVDTLAGAMELLRGEDVWFFVAGHGSKLETLRTRTRDLPRVMIADYLAPERFAHAVAAASCGVVSLTPGQKGTCAPSKYYSYLQCGLPVLSIVEPDSYLAQEAAQEGVGFSVRQGDAEGLASAIRTLRSDTALCAETGARAETLYRAQYDKSIAMGSYRALFASIGIQPSTGEADA